MLNSSGHVPTLVIKICSTTKKGHAFKHGLFCTKRFMEARVGFEPTLTVLQTGS